MTLKETQNNSLIFHILILLFPSYLYFNEYF